MSNGVPSNGAKEKSWQEKLGIIPMFPRFGSVFREIERLLDQSWPPVISILEAGKTTDIVVRFNASSHQLPSEIRQVLRVFDMRPEDAFEGVMWRKPRRKGQRRIWAELANLAYNVYREVWLHLLRRNYLFGYHPVNDKWVAAQIDSFERRTRRSAGRLAEAESEKKSLERRYEELVPLCQKVYGAASAAAWKARAVRSQGKRRTEVRKRIWESVRKQVHDKRVAVGIFAGNAFEEIAGKARSLDDPKSWTPTQLAIALLSLERGLEYDTVCRKIRPTRRKSLFV